VLLIFCFWSKVDGREGEERRGEERNFNFAAAGLYLFICVMGGFWAGKLINWCVWEAGN
jgi:hypothetical protein